MSNIPMSQEELNTYAILRMKPPRDGSFERLQKVLAFWPYGTFHKETCGFSGETIITIFSDKKFPLYKRDNWYLDSWEAPKQDISWDRPFFDQWLELQGKTPHFHLSGYKNENCDYTEDIWFSKNCYMCRHIADSEDLMYSYRMISTQESIDCTYCYYTEQCYGCVYCFHGFRVYHSAYSRNCSESYFLYDCRNCQDCVMCWNLRNKQYCIRNEQYSKEEYNAIKQSMNLHSRKELTRLQDEFLRHIREDVVHKTDQNFNSENSIGNYLFNTKNVYTGYFWESSEDCACAFRGAENKNVYNSVGMYKSELCSYSVQCTEIYQVSHAYYSANCKFCYYVDQCVDSKYLFGCVGLKKREYCIFNKQYTKDEYEELVPKLLEKIDEEYGLDKFYPPQCAYSGYNTSLCAFNIREDQTSATAKGFTWDELPTVETIPGISGADLPDSAEDVDRSYIKNVIICSITKRPYNFTEHEIEFYQNAHLPFPEHYPELRQLKRFQLIPPIETHTSRCDNCSTEITTCFTPSDGHKHVVCDACYAKLVY